MVTGVVPSPPRFLPSIFIAHRVQQSHCSSIVHRVLLTHALARSASQFVHKKKSPRIYASMHSGGFELTKLTYIPGSRITPCATGATGLGSGLGLAFTPNQFHKHHRPWQALLPCTCHEFREQHPPFQQCRLNALGVCLGKRIGVRGCVVVVLLFPPAEASEEHGVKNLPYPVVDRRVQTPRRAFLR